MRGSRRSGSVVSSMPPVPAEPRRACQARKSFHELLGTGLVGGGIADQKAFLRPCRLENRDVPRSHSAGHPGCSEAAYVHPRTASTASDLPCLIRLSGSVALTAICRTTTVAGAPSDAQLRHSPSRRSRVADSERLNQRSSDQALTLGVQP